MYFPSLIIFELVCLDLLVKTHGKYKAKLKKLLLKCKLFVYNVIETLFLEDIMESFYWVIQIIIYMIFITLFIRMIMEAANFIGNMFRKLIKFIIRKVKKLNYL